MLEIRQRRATAETATVPQKQRILAEAVICVLCNLIAAIEDYLDRPAYRSTLSSRRRSN